MLLAAPVEGCHLVKVSCLDASGGDLHSNVTPPRDQLVASMKPVYTATLPAIILSLHLFEPLGPGVALAAASGVVPIGHWLPALD